MKIDLIFIMFFFLLLTGCKKGDADIQLGNDSELRLEIVHGDNQSGEFNKPLPDSLVVRVTDKKGNGVAKAPVSFELTAGSGEISPDWALTDSAGLAYAWWTIDCNSDDNTLTVWLNDSVSNKIDSVTFSANVSRPHGWGRSCGVGYTGLYKTVFREHKGVIYLVNYDMIYTTSDGGISWQEYENMPPLSPYSDIFDIQFNSKDWMYVATEKDGVFYKEDHGYWHQINNGIQGHGKTATFLVEDTCLFISLDYGGLYRSTNNGGTWKELRLDGRSNGNYVFINRHPNGDLYLFDKRNVLWQSGDNGDSWNRIGLDYKYTNYEVEDFIVGKNGDLYIGAGDATISILSSETYQGFTHSYYEWNGSSQHVEDIKIVDGIVYYTVNGNPDPGIYSSQNWGKLSLGFEDRIYAYHLKSDGTFLIASSDGVYYFYE